MKIKNIKKKKKHSELISINCIKNKIINNNNHDEGKLKRKSLIDNNSSIDLNNRITLLVKIIKIFIKNFILYLKTRADNLLMLQNEFNIQNEASDIINAVEVSEYEKELTKHKKMKINLEYLFELYFNKYQCLFKYKEIEYETNFSELKNIYVISDDFNFSYLLGKYILIYIM